jgi:hypothetical protein
MLSGIEARLDSLGAGGAESCRSICIGAQKTWGLRKFAPLAQLGDLTTESLEMC